MINILKNNIISRNILLGMFLVFTLSLFSAVGSVGATPVFSGNVSGTITNPEGAVISGSLNSDNYGKITIHGNFTPSYVENTATFKATITSEIGGLAGVVTGDVNDMGIDTLCGIITGTGASEQVRIIGVFPQTEIKGDFYGKIITGPAPVNPVASITITSTNDATTLLEGRTLQMGVNVSPSEASDDVFWSVFVDNREIGSIDSDGLLTGLTPGSVTVIAKAKDGSHVYDTKEITIIADNDNPELNVTGFTANGSSTTMVLDDSAYTLNTDGNATTNYSIQFSADSVALENLTDEAVGLFLIPTEGQTAILQNYYGTNYPDNYEAYLKGAAAGNNPFAYIKTGGTAIQLLDGAQRFLAGRDVDMIIPGDCPVGEYRVEGQIQDLAGNKTTVTFTLKIVDSTPPVATANGSTSGTITYSFNEPVQLTNNDGSPITDGTTIASTLAVYAVNGSDYGTATKVTSVEITGATLNGNVLTITYTGTLINQADTKYIVDAWGYKISDMSGNKMLPTESAMFTVAGDGTAPELNVTGFTANGSTAMVLVDGAYTLNINGVSGTDNTIQFSTGSTVSESLKENLVALKLIPTTAQTAELKAYYSTKPEAYQTYLNAAAEGTGPFAYIKIDGTNIQLLDGAQHTLASKDVDMIIPNDYPVGTYVVSGEIEDLVGNKTTVTFTLKPEVVVDNTVSSVTVTVASGTNNATVNYNTLINKGTGTIPQTTINTSVANVSIPSSTIVTSSDTSWDGVMSVPTVTNITVPNTSSEIRTTDSAIQVGFSGARLSFSNAVKLLLPGQAQKRVGYTTDGINFIEITNTCSANTQEVGNALPSDGECKIAVGTDLVIWTKHFTTFATFTATAISYGGGGSAIYVYPTTNVVAPISSIEEESEGEVLGAEDENIEITSTEQNSNAGLIAILALVQSRIADGSMSDSDARTLLISIIQSIIGNINTPQTQSAYSCDGVTFDRDLELGSSGEDVKCLQKILNNDSETQIASSGIGSLSNETTYFGELTKNALIKFQTKHGIFPASGYFGSITRGFINK